MAYLQDYGTDELDTLDYWVLSPRYRHPSFGRVGQQIPRHLDLCSGALEEEEEEEEEVEEEEEEEEEDVVIVGAACVLKDYSDPQITSDSPLSVEPVLNSKQRH